ncbi:hypothetical protein SALBM135S_05518 [Streptomyces alboniger]
MLTAFIPFHDCTEQTGTITMVPGSHRWKRRHGAERPTGDPADAAREYLLEGDAERNGASVERVPVHIPRGHMTFHHCLLYHGSGPNRSPDPRRAISFHLQDATNTYQHYRNSEGRQQPYKHDALVRRTPALRSRTTPTRTSAPPSGPPAGETVPRGAAVLRRPAVTAAGVRAG